MFFMIFQFIVAGLLGVVIALRLMAIEAQESRSKLTVRGRVVVAVFIGIGLALIVTVINGFWWECNPAQNSCGYIWRY